MLEDSNGSIRTGGDEFLSIWRVAEERRPWGVYFEIQSLHILTLSAVLTCRSSSQRDCHFCCVELLLFCRKRKR